MTENEINAIYVYSMRNFHALNICVIQYTHMAPIYYSSSMSSVS